MSKVAELPTPPTSRRWSPHSSSTVLATGAGHLHFRKEVVPTILCCSEPASASSSRGSTAAILPCTRFLLSAVAVSTFLLDLAHTPFFFVIKLRIALYACIQPTKDLLGLKKKIKQERSKLNSGAILFIGAGENCSIGGCKAGFHPHQIHWRGSNRKA